jgi:hypothetical protein
MQWEIESHQLKMQKYFVITQSFFGLPGPSLFKLRPCFFDQKEEEYAHSGDFSDT